MGRTGIHAGLGSALAMLALGAAAQSQVTVTGNLDIGLRLDKTGGTLRTVSSNSLLPSRITIGVLEELGDGLRAQAVLEAGLTVDDGAGAVPPPGGTAGPLSFGRFSAVALGSDAAGYVSIGRQYTPLFVLGASNSADVFGGAALGGVSTVSSFTVRASNALAYTYGYGPRTLLRGAPAQGLGVAVMWAPGEAASPQDAGQQGGFNVSYGNGRWWAGYGYHQLRGNSAAINPAAAISSAPVLRQQTLSAAYTFGSWRLSAGVNQGRNGLAGPAGLDRRGWYVGSAWELGGLHEFKAFYGRVDDRSINQRDYATLQVGYAYWLSKQTQLYALAGRLNNNHRSTAVLLNTSPASIAAGVDVRSLVVGVLKRF